MALTAVALGLGGTAARTQRAGESVSNTATLRWDQDGQPHAAQSNTDRFPVAERLDVTVTPTGTVWPEGTKLIAAATLVNAGNGEEAFAVTAELPAEMGRVEGIGQDLDGDGRLDPAREMLTEGRTPPLAPGAAVTLLVAVTPVEPDAAGDLSLTARPVTGSGPAGTVYPGLGDGGSDAVVGATADHAATIPLAVPPAARPSLVKIQAVADPNGGTRPVRGATITYTLEASLPAGTPVATVADPVPAGTHYLPGSLTLDDQVLTDAVDTDPGAADASAITVSLPAATSTARHIVHFQVVIQ